MKGGRIKKEKKYRMRKEYSRGATALLINRTSGKGLIVDSTSANGPLLGNPFLTSTGWCENYFLYVFSLFATKKGVNLLLFFKNKYFDFFYCHSSQYIPTDPKI